MKALMFGWEFPPHILGGLGTASFGLTRGMAMQPDMDITFCIPKPWGDEDQSFLKIVGVGNVPVVWRDVDMGYVSERLGKYMDPQLYYDYRDHIYADFSYRHVNDLGCIEFSGRYPDNLLRKSIIILLWWVIAVPNNMIYSCARLAYLSGRDTCEKYFRKTISNPCTCNRLRSK